MDERQFRALPEKQRKAEQERLQGLGLYPAGARLDGAWGPSTDAAYALENKRAVEEAKAARDAALEEKRLEIEKLKVTSGAGKAAAEVKKTEAEAAAATAKAARREVYNRQSATTEGIGTNIAATGGAPIAGVVVGREMGKGTNALMDMAQRSRNETLKGVAADRRAGLTTREGAITAATRAGAIPYAHPVARTLSRAAPHAGLGAFALGKGAYTLSQAKDDEGFYPSMANRAIGLGWIGAGTGLMEQGIRYAASPGVAPDAQSLAVIGSNQLRRNNSAGEPDAKPASASTLAALRKEAQDLQLPGRSKLTTKNQLQLALENFRNNAKNLPKSAMLGPLAAGTLAYSATPDRAQAGTGEAGSNRSEAATNALAAGGIAYGAQKGLNAIPKGGGAMFGGAMGPSVIDAMTDAYIPADSPAYQESKRQEDMRASDAGQQTNAFLARNLPSALHFGEIARQDVSNIPPPNPLRTTPEPGNPYFPLSSQSMEEPPKNALDAAGRVPTEFGTALQEFLAMVKEMQAEQQQDPAGEQPPATLPGNFRAAPAMAGAMN